MGESELFLAHYSFGRHGHYSVEVIPKIKAQAEEFFSKDPTVMNIFMIEDAHLKQSDSERVRGFIERGFSHLDSYIHAVSSAQKGRMLSPKDLARAKRQLLSGPETAFASGLLSTMDDLSQTITIEHLRENHSDNVVRDLVRKQRVWQQADSDAFKMAGIGRFDKAAELEMEYLRGLAADVRVRNATYVTMLKEAQEQARLSGQETRFLTRVGSHHDRILRYIEDDPEIDLKPPQLTWDYDLGTEQKLPSRELLIILEDDPEARFDQERILRGMFGDVIFTAIPKMPSETLEGTNRVELACAWATTLSMNEILNTLDIRPKKQVSKM